MKKRLIQSVYIIVLLSLILPLMSISSFAYDEPVAGWGAKVTPTPTIPRPANCPAPVLVCPVEDSKFPSIDELLKNPPAPGSDEYIKMQVELAKMIKANEDKVKKQAQEDFENKVGYDITNKKWQTKKGYYPLLPSAWKDLMDEYQIVLAGIAGAGFLSCFLTFMFHMIKISTISNDPRLRRATIASILISFICTALLGGATLVMTLFYSIIFLK